MTIPTELLTAAGGVAGAALVYLGVRFTSSRSSQVADRGVALDEWQSFVEKLNGEIQRLEAKMIAATCRETQTVCGSPTSSRTRLLRIRGSRLSPNTPGL